MAKFSIALIAALAVIAVSNGNPLPCHEGCLIAVSGSASATDAAGAASDNHQALVTALGSPASGWGSEGSNGVPAVISVGNQGSSEVGNNGDIFQATFVSEEADGGFLDGIQYISAGNVVQSADSLDVAALGVDATLASSSDAAAIGSGLIAAAGNVLLLGNNFSPSRSGSDQLITIAGTGNAEGSGWAADSHAEVISAVGIPATGWSEAIPASIVVVSEGSSEVGSGGALAQLTGNNGVELTAIQTNDVYNIAQAQDSLDVAVIGAEVSVASSSDASAGGAASLAATGDVIIVNDIANSVGLGMVNPLS